MGGNRDLALVCKIWGFLKYHHPGLTDGRVDWDGSLVKILEELGVKDAQPDLDAIAWRLLREAGGPQHPCESCRIDLPEKPELNGMYKFWTGETSLSPELRKELEILQFQPRKQNYYIQANPNVGNPVFKNEKAYDEDLFPTRPYRLLSLFRFWNVIRYFYPYLYMRSSGEWDRVLDRFIGRFENARDITEYHLLVMELVAALNDGHGTVSSEVIEGHFGNLYLPVIFKWVEGRVVVWQSGTSELAKGDIILAVDGRPTEKIREELRAYAPGSNQAGREHSLNFLMLTGSEQEARLTVKRETGEVALTVPRITKKEWIAHFIQVPSEASAWKRIGEAGYIDMKVLKKTQIEKVFADLKNAPAIIFDLRNYPAFVLYQLGEKLNPKSMPFVSITRPDLNQPGIFVQKPTLSVGPNYRNEDYYKGWVLILVDETTMSRAEFTVMALQTAPRVRVIGSQTAGADGNVSTLPLPGGIRARFTGTGIFYPNGAETQGVGITPDIEIRPTILGIQNNKDEILERALLFIKNHGS